jgi:hypothetical protein
VLSNLLDFDASDILALIAGAVLAIIAEPARVWIMNRYDGGTRKIPMPPAKVIVGVIVFAALIWSLWSTASIQHELTANSRQSLLIAEAVCEEQKLATTERAALHKLFLAALAVPPEIRALPQDDPARIKWGADLVNEYVGTLERTNAARRELADRFAHNPPTEPTCGRQ